jgi:hypothetical protein
MTSLNWKALLVVASLSLGAGLVSCESASTPPATDVKAPDAKGDAMKSPDAKGDAMKSPDAKGDAMKSPDAKGDAMKSPDAKGDAMKSPASKSLESPEATKKP